MIENMFPFVRNVAKKLQKLFSTTSSTKNHNQNQNILWTGCGCGEPVHPPKVKPKPLQPKPTPLVYLLAVSLLADSQKSVGQLAVCVGWLVVGRLRCLLVDLVYVRPENRARTQPNPKNLWPHKHGEAMKKSSSCDPCSRNLWEKDNGFLNRYPKHPQFCRTSEQKAWL